MMVPRMREHSRAHSRRDTPGGTPPSNSRRLPPPQFHIITLAKEGLTQVLESTDLEPEKQAALRSNVAICNVDGSIDDDCAPLTMTIKARIYALAAPRSVEIRHEYHRRQG